MILRALGTAAAAITAATGAAACCAPPFLVGLLGLSSAGLGGVLEPYRPVFLAAAACVFGFGFLSLHRRWSTDCDEDGCGQRKTGGFAIGILVTALCLSLLVAFYPSWRSWF